jgi:glycosyltransferase involved in cell wall biosynthesis
MQAFLLASYLYTGTNAMKFPYGKSIVSVKHTYFESAGTPEAEMVRFLKGKAASILYIRHPFPDARQIRLNTTVVEYGADGNVVKEITAPAIHGNALLFYLKDLILSVYYVFRSGRKYDLYVGSDNLNSLAGIILRILGRVRKVAFYVIDFTPVRFHGKLMNAVYQAINKFCCYHADVIWNVSPAMIEGREKIGIGRSRSAPRIVVPLGCDVKRIQKFANERRDRNTLVYFGALRHEHGPGLILESLPAILRTIPDARVIFAGDGEMRESLESRAKELGVIARVQFTGFLSSDEEVYRILSGCGLALATYPPDDSTYKLYCDPGKVKIYLACGLPVLITDVPAVAGEIAERGAGEIVAYDPESLAEKATGILANPEKQESMSKQALNLAAEYDWDAIWERTFGEMENLTHLTHSQKNEIRHDLHD